MRLICPNCEAQYEVADNAIPDEGRDVQCSNCGTTWFQDSADALAAAAAQAEATPPEPEPQPEPEPVVEPEPQPEPGPEPEPVVEPEPQPEPEPAPEPAPAPSLSEAAAAILQEEAEREREARFAETEALETQTEFSVDEPGFDEPVFEPDESQPVVVAPAPQPPHRATSESVADTPAPRQQLPDIEEINSTLETARTKRDSQRAILTEDEQDLPSRRPFRAGFITAVTVAVVLVAAYVYAPQLSVRVPALAPTLAAFSETTDALRFWLEGWVTSSVQALTRMMSDAAG
jgi:predicted Zn finger-like uncharacterized protein